ncbi:MAG: hypothetical protein CMH13_20690 [Martelella sp.]|uniref:hypothetical protein n=1 Tax=Martelella sp. UBA3392 TaxID=1946834 RepID=UPI000C60E28B|nr:hypothetical protein [Martelella sp.]
MKLTIIINKISRKGRRAQNAVAEKSKAWVMLILTIARHDAPSIRDIVFKRTSGSPLSSPQTRQSDLPRREHASDRVQQDLGGEADRLHQKMNSMLFDTSKSGWALLLSNLYVVC